MLGTAERITPSKALELGIADAVSTHEKDVDICTAEFLSKFDKASPGMLITIPLNTIY